MSLKTKRAALRCTISILDMCMLSYAPTKTNEYGAFQLLNELICMGSSSRKAGPAGYT